MNITVSRRQFLTWSMYGSALVIAAPLSKVQADVSAAGTGKYALTPLVSVHPDNRITFYYPSPEMGQGTDTSLAMLFVEEMDGDMDKVKVEPLPYLLKKDEAGKISALAVPQFAGGSTSITRNFPLLREAGAQVRQLMLQAASKYFDQPLASLSASKSYVSDGTGKQVSYGALAELASLETLDEAYSPQLKSKADWQTLGKRRLSTQAEMIVTGQPLYAMDMDYPGVKVAVMARCPYLDGHVEKLNTSKAEKLDGVLKIVQLPRPDLDKYYTYLAAGVAVIAEDYWTAKKAKDLLEIRWNKGPFEGESTEKLDEQCRTLLKQKGQIVRDDGDYEKAIENADKVIEHTYRLPTISHAQMEPHNCIAHVSKDNCTVIAPMQSPGGASRLAAQITGFDRTKMDIRYTRLGGGFGRRLNSDHVAEAVMISKLSGFPVKVIWTREDDICHDFYRPMAHHKMTAGLDKNREVTAWSHKRAGRPKYYRRNNTKPEDMFGADLYVDDFPANLVKNLRNEYLIAHSGLPQGSWRAPAHTANAFVVQSFIDEIAKEIDVDPLIFQLNMLGEAQKLEYGQHGGPVFDTGRLTGVLKKVAEMAGWPGKKRKGRALGVAGHFTFGGYCAHIADVEIKPDKTIKVHQVWAAIDVGTVINPEGVIAQVEGGINDGLSTALGQQVLVEDAMVKSDNFDTYSMIRLGDSVTKIHVSVIQNDEPPSGAGEMGLPPLAPAVANAIAAAGGPRIRAQPFYINGKLRS